MTGRPHARGAGSTLVEPGHPDPTPFDSAPSHPAPAADPTISSPTLPDATLSDPSPAASKDPTAP